MDRGIWGREEGEGALEVPGREGEGERERWEAVKCVSATSTGISQNKSYICIKAEVPPGFCEVVGPFCGGVKHSFGLFPGKKET